MAPTCTSTSSAERALRGRTVLLGVSGGIAAYKACELARLLVKAEAEVHVLMTEAATRFVAPLTFAALTGQTPQVGLFPRPGGTPSELAMAHTELGLRAGLMVIAPATADLLGRLAAGLATDALSTTFMVRTCPVLLCPAMNTGMWQSPIVQRNLATLEALPRVHTLPPDSGELACGVVGPGRLPDPLRIVERAAALLHPKILAGRRVLVTGGPTREYLDPVRFLSNPSTGAMAISLSAALRDLGAEVNLVLGPTTLSPPAGVHTERVTSAEEMAAAVDALLESGQDAFCGCAAVADWRPATTRATKEHKRGAARSVDLVRTPDILAELVAPRRARGDLRVVLGFAAETTSTEDELAEVAEAKRQRKGCDLLFANSVEGERRGFGWGESRGLLLGLGEPRSLGPAPKEALARALARALAEALEAP